MCSSTKVAEYRDGSKLDVGCSEHVPFVSVRNDRSLSLCSFSWNLWSSILARLSSAAVYVPSSDQSDKTIHLRVECFTSSSVMPLMNALRMVPSMAGSRGLRAGSCRITDTHCHCLPDKT